MDFGILSTTWAALDATARIVILTEAARMPLAERIRADNAAHVAEVRAIDIGTGDAYRREMDALTAGDLLVVLLTTEGFMNRGYRERFSPFAKPPGFRGKYIFVRLDIPEASLLRGLHTDLAKVDSTVRACRAFQVGSRVRVTTDKGTDITTVIGAQEVLPYEARSPGGHAFLPPAEVSEDLVRGATNGIIVADVTVGELRFGAELIDPLGLVDRDVILTVREGLVVDIAGGDIADRLRAGLGRLDGALRAVVELGHGLSDLAPTGIIGVDESMRGTCHFGIGDRDPYHVDVVVANPHIEVDDA